MEILNEKRTINQVYTKSFQDGLGLVWRLCVVTDPEGKGILGISIYRKETGIVVEKFIYLEFDQFRARI
jgi:hypothetical protein